jgi:calcineurin-binding protein cabin-1
MRFIAFNVPQERDQFKEIDTKDVKVKKAFENYNKALILQNKGEYDKAKNIYEELMKIDIFNEELQKVKTIQSSPIHLVRFVVLKNYAVVLEKENNIDKAIDYYEKAILIDSTDTNLWYKIGELYFLINYYENAYNAYKHALENSNTSISLWKALTGLSNVLYEMGDFITCLKYVNRALEINSGWVRGIWIKYDILWEFTQNLSFNSTLPLRCTFSDIQEFNNKREELKLLFEKYPEETKKRKSECFCKLEHSCKNIDYTLENNNWKELGELLLKIYNELIKKKQGVESCVLAQVNIKYNISDIPMKSPSEASTNESKEELKNESNDENKVNTNDRKRKKFLLPEEDKVRTSKRVREKIEQETRQTEEKDVYFNFKKKINFIIPNNYNYEMGGMINDEINSNQQPVSIYLINDIKLLESNIEYKLLGLKMSSIKESKAIIDSSNKKINSKDNKSKDSLNNN